MPLPYTFGNLSLIESPWWDSNYAALGVLTPIPCSVSGTNALVLTPLTNTPTVPAYQNYSPFTCIAAATNTGAATARIGSLAALAIYKDTASGPTPLVGGEVPQGNLISLTYDSALAGGSGGFHLRSVTSGAGTVTQIVAGTGLTGGTITGSGTIGISAYSRWNTTTATITWTAIAPQTTQDQTVALAGATINDNVLIGPPASVTSGILFSAFVSASNAITVRAANVTSGTITPAAAAYRVTAIG